MKQTLRFLGLGSVLVAPMAFGAGFQLNEFSVTAMGRAQAGEPAMSDTAAAMARNPAAMGAFDKASVSVVYHHIDPDVDVEGQVNGVFNADAEDVAPSASVPGLYYIQPINEQWAVGLSLNSYFGLSTDYGSQYMASEFAEETSIKTYYLTPTVSYKPVENVTVGVGINYVYGEGKIKNSTTPAIALGSGGTIPAGTTALDLDGDGDAFGYHLGVQWAISDATTMGLRYQSRVNLDLDGDMILFVPGLGPQNFTGTLTMNLPEMYELGLVHQYNERLSLMAGIQKTGWHTFRTLTAKIDNAGARLLKDEDWQDAWRYSIGAEFKALDKLTVRVGYGYDESPVKDDKRTLTIPDADRNWYSIGGSYDLDDLGSIDVAFLYLDGNSVDVNETSAFGTTFSGELTSTGASIFSVGYNYSF